MIRSRTHPTAAQTAPVPQQVRTRVRPAAEAAPPPQTAIRARTAPQAAPANVGWMHRGDSADAVRSQEVAAQQERRERSEAGLYMPYRFRLKPGEQGEIVVLDAQLGPHWYEHDLTFENRIPRQKGGVYEACPREFELCPLCAAFKESYWAMFLTCQVLIPYRNSDGQVVPHSKKLLVAKTSSQDKFKRLFDRHGTLRGMQLLMARDGQRSPQIGDPEFIEMHPEQVLIETFGHAPIMSKRDPSKVIKPENADCYPFDYERLFQAPSAEAIRRKYRHALGVHGEAPAGSLRQAEEELEEGEAPAPTRAAPAYQVQRTPDGAQRTIGARFPQQQAPAAANAQGDDFDDLDDEIPF